MTNSIQGTKETEAKKEYRCELGVFKVRWLFQEAGKPAVALGGREGFPYFLLRKRKDDAFEMIRHAGAQERDSDLGNGPQRVNHHTLAFLELCEQSQ